MTPLNPITHSLHAISREIPDFLRVLEENFLESKSPFPGIQGVYVVEKVLKWRLISRLNVLASVCTSKLILRSLGHDEA